MKYLLLIILLTGCSGQALQIEMVTTSMACNEIEEVIVERAEDKKISVQQAKALVATIRVACDELFERLEKKANEMDN